VQSVLDERTTHLNRIETRAVRGPARLRQTARS
jgi:hypothetical protein